MFFSGHRTASTFRRYDVTSREDNREDMQRATEYRRKRFGGKAGGMLRNCSGFRAELVEHQGFSLRTRRAASSTNPRNQSALVLSGRRATRARRMPATASPKTPL